MKGTHLAFCVAVFAGHILGVLSWASHRKPTDACHMLHTLKIPFMLCMYVGAYNMQVHVETGGLC